MGSRLNLFFNEFRRFQITNVVGTISRIEMTMTMMHPVCVADDEYADSFCIYISTSVNELVDTDIYVVETDVVNRLAGVKIYGVIVVRNLFISCRSQKSFHLVFKVSASFFSLSIHIPFAYVLTNVLAVHSGAIVI